MELTGRLLICFLILLTSLAAKNSNSDSKIQNFSSPPEKVGTLTVKINGTQYSGDLYSELNPYSYRVFAGNKDYEVRLEWKYAASPSDIRVGAVDLSKTGNDMDAGYINFRVSYNFVTRSGYLTVEENDGKRIFGLFSFVAAGTSNYPGGKTSGSPTVQTLSDGTFEINYGK